ncbi:MAG: site-specific DNA-methyltransferase [Dysgonomonas sp.]|uniref:DNA-methyltransferase n=1 Tax=Dysgonomonas sp. TaxID=1891233 RepID=UPI0039E504AF
MQIEEKLKNKIYNVDSRKILNILGDSIRIKSTITSPPYFDMKDYGSDNQIGFGQTYEDYLDDLKQIFSKIYKITSDDGSLWIVIDSFKRENQVVTLPFDLSNKLKEEGWLLQDIIIWKKDKTVPWSNNGFVQRKFEYILFFTKTKDFKYNKDRVRNFDTSQLKKWWVKYPERYNPKGKALDEIWEFPIPVQGSWGDKYIRHFCPLPKEMVATMIEISTDPNDLILDPFAGSGSVLFQSSIMKRDYIGFELNLDYINMFTQYLNANRGKLEKEYIQLQQLGSQEEFRKRILDLRSLKFGRLLVNEINKKLNVDLKVFVEIIEYYDNPKTHIKVEYQFLGHIPNKELLINEINTLINKPPLSKFGIKSIFKFSENKHLNNNNYYCYTDSNSYSFSDLPATSPKIKVISQICVNLNENDYI